MFFNSKNNSPHTIFILFYQEISKSSRFGNNFSIYLYFTPIGFFSPLVLYTIHMTSRKGVFVLVFIVTAILVSFFWNFLTQSFDSTRLFPPKNIFLGCETLKDISKRYDCYEGNALHALQNGSSIPTLNIMQFEIKDHWAGHAIGGAALIISKHALEKAAQMCMPDVCDDAYIHGVATGWNKYAPSRINEFSEFLDTICTSEIFCAHRLGHFYESAYEDSEQALALCDAFKDNSAFSQCIQGFMHEKKTDTETGNTKDILELCPNYAGRKRTACYMYASYWYTDSFSGPKGKKLQLDIEDKLAQCKEINEKTPNELNFCYYGIANSVRREGEAPKLTWCNDLKSDFKKVCIDGLTKPLTLNLASCGGEEISENEIPTCTL